jgi:hypothetical protein
VTNGETGGRAATEALAHNSRRQHGGSDPPEGGCALALATDDAL